MMSVRFFEFNDSFCHTSSPDEAALLAIVRRPLNLSDCAPHATRTDGTRKIASEAGKNALQKSIPSPEAAPCCAEYTAILPQVWEEDVPLP